jgi:hypothetical protein
MLPVPVERADAMRLTCAGTTRARTCGFEFALVSGMAGSPMDHCRNTPGLEAQRFLAAGDRFAATDPTNG